MEYVLNKLTIGKKMTKNIDRPIISMKTKFFQAIKRSIDQLIYFYAENTIKPFCKLN